MLGHASSPSPRGPSWGAVRGLALGVALASLGCAAGANTTDPNFASSSGGGHHAESPSAGGAGGNDPAGGSPAGGGPAGSTDDAGGGSDAPAPVSSGDAAGDAPAGVVPLPLVVTDHFNNRGWFGDGSISMFFKQGSTIIEEVSSATGPCASRPAGAKGKCLQFTYTPPPGLAAPQKGAFIGDYMLPTLARSHPEASPPAKVGDPNWGIEPGIPVASGARRVTFYAASAEPNLRVAFHAGSDHDDVLLPEYVEVLATGWRQISMTLAGGDTGPRLVGGFAWTLKDTSRPATFYVDSIVWDAEGILPPTPPEGKQDGVRALLVINKCAEPIWVGIGSQMTVPEGGGFKLDAGQMHTVTTPGGLWSGRFWGRTGCSFNGDTGACATGDCGGKLGCGVVGGKPPATLAEITLSAGAPNPDFYDISVVDGYNLPMAIAPLRGTHGRNPGAPLDCLVPSCVSDLNATCPADLRMLDGGGKVVGCRSACEKLKTDQFCCTGAYNQPETCPPFDDSKIFKKACPTAYSYAYDDSTSTFTCKGEDYAIWFCP